MKRILAGLLLSFALTTPSWAELDRRAIHEITVICEQLFADYAVYIDHLDADGFASTFTEDGYFFHDEYGPGREGLRKYIRAHGTQAHLIMITTTDINVISESQATGLAYAIVLGGDEPRADGDKPVQMQGINAALEYIAEFELTDEGWKISSMDRKAGFRGPGSGQNSD